MRPRLVAALAALTALLPAAPLPAAGRAAASLPTGAPATAEGATAPTFAICSTPGVLAALPFCPAAATAAQAATAAPAATAARAPGVARAPAAPPAPAALRRVTPASADPVCAPVPLLAERCPRWVAAYQHDGGTGNVATGVATAPDGTTVYVTGVSATPGGNADFATVAYDAATGEVRWTTRYNGGGADSPAALAVDPDGRRVYVTGLRDYVYDSLRRIATGDVATVAYDAVTGEELWVAAYDEPGGRLDAGYRIAAGPDGPVVAAVSRGAPTSDVNYDVLTLAYDRDGHERWHARWDSAVRLALDAPVDVAVSADGGRVFLAANASGYGNRDVDLDYVTLSYAGNGPDAGALRWEQRFDARGKGADYAYALALAPDGRAVYVTGGVQEPSLPDTSVYATVAYDAVDGRRRWVSEYRQAAPGENFAFDVVVAPNGRRVYVAGASAGSDDRDTDFGVLAHDAATGTLLWATADGIPGMRCELAGRIAVSHDDERVYVIGPSYRYCTGSLSYVTLAFATNDGSRAWSGRHRGATAAAPGDVAFALAVAPAGGVYVAGAFAPDVAGGRRTSAFGTLAYDR